MDHNETTGKITPYYTEMKNIMERLRELGKLDYPYKRTRYIPGGGTITEDVPEYLEEQELIRRWYELRKYEMALDPFHCKNHLLISLRIGFSVKAEYNPELAARIAISVYQNSPIN